MRMRCSFNGGCDVSIDRKTDEHWTMSWTYGNGSFIIRYFCKEHRPVAKKARIDHRIPEGSRR